MGVIVSPGLMGAFATVYEDKENPGMGMLVIGGEV
jgi:hypothetical protein